MKKLFMSFLILACFNFSWATSLQGERLFYKLSPMGKVHFVIRLFYVNNLKLSHFEIENLFFKKDEISHFEILQNEIVRRVLMQVYHDDLRGDLNIFNVNDLRIRFLDILKLKSFVNILKKIEADNSINYLGSLRMVLESKLLNYQFHGHFFLVEPLDETRNIIEKASVFKIDFDKLSDLHLIATLLEMPDAKKAENFVRNSKMIVANISEENDFLVPFFWLDQFTKSPSFFKSKMKALSDIFTEGGQYFNHPFFDRRLTLAFYHPFNVNYKLSRSFLYEAAQNLNNYGRWIPVYTQGPIDKILRDLKSEQRVDKSLSVLEVLRPYHFKDQIQLLKIMTFSKDDLITKRLCELLSAISIEHPEVYNYIMNLLISNSLNSNKRKFLITVLRANSKLNQYSEQNLLEMTNYSADIIEVRPDFQNQCNKSVQTLIQRP